MNKYVEAFEKVKEACASFDTVDELITLKELVEKATPKMTAREVFEQLGYVFKEYPYQIDYTNKYDADNYVLFDLECKTVSVDECMIIDIPTFKAMHQQLKELGWI